MITVIDEHPDFLITLKPANVDFHDCDGEPGFMSRLSRQFGKPLWPVHRLDKPTSGLLLVATSAQACAALSAQFSERQVEKFYLALAHGRPKKKQGLIKGDMARSRRGSWKLLPTTTNPAITQFFSYGAGPGRRLYLLKPHTGKTHQLRVALKSLSAPIEGDSLYGGEPSTRLHLHAFQLGFEWEGQWRRYQQLPTEDFQAMVERFAPKEWQAPHQLLWPTVGKGTE
ncbi:TIGR01621 family pseudouridine synthase [Marinibactrum halimedae]|uniref:RNA pseudouridine synthase n=1 Tax=Marinibactrum halimedae TaxID=1444977 RepID=A0AA37T932_9GAMM|nr:TIGR01621 family pseudouridine synthase [Marinibactrum halimedae]MCD9460603.1 TIGR01621 family pseudouridine synthase [Marinibactrum halimedae]GLS27819.1 RNA pseudouridine synthase [Marinibactrum halimedae]